MEHNKLLLYLNYLSKNMACLNEMENLTGNFLQISNGLPRWEHRVIPFLIITKVQIVSFIGGGNNSIDPRFISHFSVFYIAPPSRESLFRIFSTILQGHVRTFPIEIQELIPHLINSTLEIYEDILRLFVPTPTKFYYIFSLRDLSRIIQSLLRTTPERFDTTERFTRVWLHECIRVFSDRFNDLKDEELFQNILENNSLIKDHRNYLFRKPILFGDYRTALQDDEAKIYEELRNYSRI
jgi:dynein heavy chain